MQWDPQGSHAASVDRAGRPTAAARRPAAASSSPDAGRAAPPRRPSAAGAVPSGAASASRSSRTTRAGLPAAITPAGIERVTTLPAPTTESAPMVTPLRILVPSPTKTFSPDARAPWRADRRAAGRGAGRGSPSPGFGRSSRGARARRCRCRALALDVGVVVVLRAVPELDDGVRPRGLQVDIARVKLRRRRPAEAYVASDAYRAAAEEQDRLVDDPRAAHVPARRKRAVFPDPRDLDGVAQMCGAPHEPPAHVAGEAVAAAAGARGAPLQGRPSRRRETLSASSRRTRRDRRP